MEKALLSESWRDIVAIGGILLGLLQILLALRRPQPKPSTSIYPRRVTVLTFFQDAISNPVVAWTITSLIALEYLTFLSIQWKWSSVLAVVSILGVIPVFILMFAAYLWAYENLPFKTFTRLRLVLGLCSGTVFIYVSYLGYSSGVEAVDVDPIIATYESGKMIRIFMTSMLSTFLLFGVMES